MVSFNPGDIKSNLMNSIRTCLYPQQLDYSSSISLFSEGGQIVQSFYPFSSTISTIGIYISNTIGTSGAITLSVISGSSTLRTSTISSSIGWNYLDVNTGNLVTAREGSIIISRGDVTEANDYYIGSSSSSKYYFGSAGTFNVAFTIGIQDFVYKLYPIKRIDADDLPVVVVDIIGRPRIRDKYLSGDFVWYYMTLRAEIYSKYTHELDKLIYGCDRGILNIRKTFPDIYYITPSQISSMGYVKPEVFYRDISWTFAQLVSKE